MSKLLSAEEKSLQNIRLFKSVKINFLNFIKYICSLAKDIAINDGFKIRR